MRDCIHRNSSLLDLRFPLSLHAKILTAEHYLRNTDSDKTTNNYLYFMLQSHNDLGCFIPLVLQDILAAYNELFESYFFLYTRYQRMISMIPWKLLTDVFQMLSCCTDTRLATPVIEDVAEKHSSLLSYTSFNQALRIPVLHAGLAIIEHFDQVIFHNYMGLILEISNGYYPCKHNVLVHYCKLFKACKVHDKQTLLAMCKITYVFSDIWWHCKNNARLLANPYSEAPLSILKLVSVVS